MQFGGASRDSSAFGGMPLSSQVATQISWSPLIGLKGVKLPLQFTGCGGGAHLEPLVKVGSAPGAGRTRAARVAWVPIIVEMQGGQMYLYIQEVADYLTPPVAALFLLAIFWKRCNEQGAFYGGMAGFILGRARVCVFCLYLCVCAWSCLTFCNPMDCSPPGSSVHGILQASP